VPLSEKSLVLLNQLKSIDCSEALGSEHEDLITDTFKKILSSGDTYKIGEIENWLDNNPQINHVVTERILNVAHYQKVKYDAKNPLKMAPDSCGCGGDC
jgi:hypothetical protein